MKKFALIVALLVIPMAIGSSANAADNNEQYTQKQQVQTQQTEVNRPQSKNDYSDDYLLKYNIDDLEAAPWLHGGQRVY